MKKLLIGVVIGLILVLAIASVAAARRSDLRRTR